MLRAADVVVTHAGQNALAEVAAAPPSRRRGARRTGPTTSSAATAACWPRPLAGPGAAATSRARAGPAARARPRSWTARGGRTGATAGRPTASPRVVDAAAPLPAPPPAPRAWRTRQAAVVTVAHGRHEHLRRQRAVAGERVRRRDEHVVVGDGATRTSTRGPRTTTFPTWWSARRRPRRPAAGPRPQRRRAPGARTRCADCWCCSTSTAWPAPTWSPATPSTVGAVAGDRVVRAGDLPPARARPRSYRLARGSSTTRTRRGPRPRPGEVVARRRPRAVLVAVVRRHRRGLAATGGFCEDYVGYGGEDTDFGRRSSTAAWASAGWATPAPTTSTTRRRVPGASTRRTSSATPTCSTAAGAGGPCRAGCDAFERPGPRRADARGLAGHRRRAGRLIGPRTYWS